MFSTIDSSWQKILSDEFKKSYFLQLEKEINEEYQNAICYPPKESIFAAFNYCSFANLKVVIIGQDPYHGE